ncbi:hypothetical protein [Niallia sp. Krafla_26]|uniref:hypothetical protein n=1 Tax=Niallia sp. Krafla_26 TaxID=3064703 RepID=UPI003D16D510
MYYEKKTEYYSQFKINSEQQTEAFFKKLGEKRFKKKLILQNELESQTESLDKILKENVLINNQLKKIGNILCSMQKTKPTPKNPFNFLEKFDFDIDKLLNILMAFIDQYKENPNVNKKEDLNVNENESEKINEERELLNRILNELSILNNKISLFQMPPMGQPLKTLNKFDFNFDKISSILSLLFQIYKAKNNENENESEELNEEVL